MNTYTSPVPPGYLARVSVVDLIISQGGET